MGHAGRHDRDAGYAKRPGGHGDTRSRLPVLEEFYDGYEKAFVLPNEREELEGFRDCLALNLAPRREALDTPLRNVLRNRPDRPGWHARADGRRGQSHRLCTEALCRRRRPAADDHQLELYVHREPAPADADYLRALLETVAPTARTMLGLEPHLPALTFIEQNDPLRMSVDDYVRDTKATGLDQVDRIAIWARLGALVVDFPYVQPPLSATQAPEELLVFSVLGASKPRLSACRLEHHLRRFFAISVLKGGSPDDMPSARNQLVSLADLCRRNRPIDLLDPQPWIASDGPRIRLKGRPQNAPPDLRTALSRGALAR